MNLFFWLVGPGGIEPPTSPLSGVRSSHLSYGPKCSNLLPWTNTGGAGRDRTGDLLNANQALSQLSYSPKSTALLSQNAARKKSIEASWMQRPGEPAPGRSEKRRTSSGDTRTGSPYCRSRYGGLEWNGCLLLYPVYTQQGFFRKLHPRSLLERR